MTFYPLIGTIGASISEPISMESFLDSYVDFNFIAFVPYLIYLFFPLWGVFLCLDRKITAEQITGLYITFIIFLLFCYVIFLIFPTTAESVMIREYDPDIMSLQTFEILQGLYDSSVPYGAFPSYHVVPLVVWSIFTFKFSRVLFWMTLPISLMASYGTVALKFHAVVDPIGGLIIGLVGYYVLYDWAVEKVAKNFFSKKIILNRHSIADIIRVSRMKPIKVKAKK